MYASLHGGVPHVVRKKLRGLNWTSWILGSQVKGKLDVIKNMYPAGNSRILVYLLRQILPT